ncbi:MAG: prephenate dehydrogenase [Candidatus Omnitrophota bacterium]|nr:prephenate dehydrogenase [Candidatus Omnitrophota bacterium]MDZ4242810.1 prephenate dehydrogenase [Candidatus Omnitrophota bacterium]
MITFRPSFLFRKVTVIGVGLIGGSLGMAMKQRKLAFEIVGVSQQSSSLTTALKNNAIDKASNDIKDAVSNADLVILSTPVSIIASLLPRIGPYLKRNCIITDVGSTKAAIVSAAQKYLPPHAHFVGSHPLAGSEKRGAEFASSGFFENSICLMTPVEQTNKIACDRVKELWTKVGASVKFLAPDDHDKALAFISHLPHVVAYSLMGSIPDDSLGYAAQGLKDTTRIASSNPQMWIDICMANKRNLVASIDEFVKHLAAVRKAIIGDDQQSLTTLFKNAKTKRDALG